MQAMVKEVGVDLLQIINILRVKNLMHKIQVKMLNRLIRRLEIVLEHIIGQMNFLQQEDNSSGIEVFHCIISKLTTTARKNIYMLRSFHIYAQDHW